MQRFFTELVKRFIILWFPFCAIVPAFAQEEEPPQQEIQNESPALAPVPDVANPSQNAVLEGVQISSEPGKLPDENVVTCYFIFKEKPTSYFYEIKKKTKKLIFEFNDVQKGASPIPSVMQTPIDSFVVEQKKVDVNKEVKGLNPEWHDLVTVTFSLNALPIINVTDEYNVISFTYKWTSDAKKLKSYVMKDDKPNMPILVGGGILAAAAIAGGIWYIVKPPPPPPVDEPLDRSDLPSHKTP